MRKLTLFVFVLAASCFVRAGVLDDLESRAQKIQNTPAGQAELEAITQEVLKLVETDGLQTGLDFSRAAKLVANPFFRLERSRIRHELTVTAVALGHTDSMDLLAGTWDEVILATGRRRPFGVRQIPFQNGPGERFSVEPAPRCVQDVLLSPAIAREKVKKRKDNKEIARIVEADQNSRKQPFGPITADEGLRLWREDRTRFSRINDLVEHGDVHTAADFERASLVCQHGGTFEDYQLAHELALCALVLGSENATWLVGATYDRMLLSASYPQRFATQFLNNNLEQVDSSGINDTERKAVVHGTLDDARRQERTLQSQGK